MRGLAWARLAVASVSLALSPLLAQEKESVRFALVAGLLWLPWAWLALLLTERESGWRRLISVAGDSVVLGLSMFLLPSLRSAQAIALAVLLCVHAIVFVARIRGARQRAATMTAATEQRLGILLEAMPVVMWTTDGQLNITSWLGRREEWEGLMPQGSGRISLTDHLPRHDPALLQAHQVVLQGEQADCEISLGSSTYQAFLRPLKGPRGVIGVVGAALDITDRKLAEDAKTMFLATASHELKTPLTVIKGFAETLSNDPHAVDDPLREEALNAMVRRSEELTKIVDRLLLSSRIESHGAEMTIEDVDPIGIFRERLQAVQGSTGRRILLTTDPLVPNVAADRIALSTTIDHLVDNAIKYSPGGEPVHVSIRSEPETLIVQVTDEGVGMSKDQLQRCFDKFWQADGTDRRRFPGTGIGLFIVRSLVESMGGQVWAESEPGKGSRFSFSLRRADARRADVSDAERPGVGDSSVIREFMRQIGVPTGGGK